jgi:alkanesulfonate monooxygenase SsuD/methylene tetrahydromethanopterin reductase-like flavin-dependent oxidoreductase (luciferase family)
MRIGVLFLFHEPTVRPGPMAKEMERLGFESLWVPEHPVLPVNPGLRFLKVGRFRSNTLT